MSEKPSLFKPPPHTFNIFDDFIDEDEETAQEEHGGVIDLTKSPDHIDETVDKTINGAGDLHNDNDDEEVGIFAHKFKRPRHKRHTTNTAKIPTLTQQGRRLPKHLRTGYRRDYQDIIMGRESYNQDLDHYEPTSPPPPPPRTMSTTSSSYASVHSTPPSSSSLSSSSTLMIPTGGGGYLCTNSFMTSTQRKRMEHLEKAEKATTELEDYLANCPNDVKLRAKLLHIQSFKRRLEKNENATLNASEARIVRDIGKMLEARKVANEAAEYERQAKVQMGLDESSVPAKSCSRKRGNEGLLSPESSGRGDSMSHSRQSSFSPSYHPTTGGKTVGPDYYQRRKRSRVMYEEEGGGDADDEDEDGHDGDEEDVVWKAESQERRTHGGKTVAQGNLLTVSQYDVQDVLKEVEEEESAVEEECDDESSADDTESSVDTDFEVGKGGNGNGNGNGGAEAQNDMGDESGSVKMEDGDEDKDGNGNASRHEHEHGSEKEDDCGKVEMGDEDDKRDKHGSSNDS